MSICKNILDTSIMCLVLIEVLWMAYIKALLVKRAKNSSTELSFGTFGTKNMPVYYNHNLISTLASTYIQTHSTNVYLLYCEGSILVLPLIRMNELCHYLAECIELP